MDMYEAEKRLQEVFQQPLGLSETPHRLLV